MKHQTHHLYMKTTNEKNTAPAFTTRAGTIRASIWESQHENGPRHKIVVNRLFRQGDVWQQGRTFYASELAAVVEAVSKAQQWIQFRRRQLENPQPAAQPAK